jgi:hypothetical protein
MAYKSYWIHYLTVDGKQLKYCEIVRATSADHALQVADQKYPEKRRPKTAVSRTVNEMQWRFDGDNDAAACTD